MPDTLPAKLKAWRERQGLTQAEAAAKLAVPVATWRGWEQGRHAPRGLALKVVLEMVDSIC